jgi:hypothetical protein
MVWALHAVLISTKEPLEKVKKQSQDIIKDKNRTFYRIEGEHYRFRNLSKQKFSEFRSKIINDNITLIFGKLKKEYLNLK